MYLPDISTVSLPNSLNVRHDMGFIVGVRQGHLKFDFPTSMWNDADGMFRTFHLCVSDEAVILGRNSGQRI